MDIVFLHPHINIYLHYNIILQNYYDEYVCSTKHVLSCNADSVILEQDLNLHKFRSGH